MQCYMSTSNKNAGRLRLINSNLATVKGKIWLISVSPVAVRLYNSFPAVLC